MSIFDEIKNQIKADEDMEKEDLPWTFENLSNKDNSKNQKSKIDRKKLTRYGVLIVLMVIFAIGVFNFLNAKENIKLKQVNTENKDDKQDKEIQVHITGEVNKPGLYKLKIGSRIWDVVQAAGGFTETADQNTVNLAKNVEDGEQIIINSNQSGSVQNQSQDKGQAAQQVNGKININTADLTALQTLSGVGPSTAQKIIDYRNQNGKFKSIDDIKNISGIGEKTFNKFKDKICI